MVSRPFTLYFKGPSTHEQDPRLTSTGRLGREGVRKCTTVENENKIGVAVIYVV